MALPFAMMKVGLSAPIVLVFCVACVYQAPVFMLESFHQDGDFKKRQLRFYYWHGSTAACGRRGTVFMANLQRVCYFFDNGWALVLSSTTINSVLELGESTWVLIFSAIIVVECVWCPNQNALFWISTIGIINTFVCCFTLIGISVVTAAEEPSLWETFETWEFFDLSGFFCCV